MLRQRDQALAERAESVPGADLELLPPARDRRAARAERRSPSAALSAPPAPRAPRQALPRRGPASAAASFASARSNRTSAASLAEAQIPVFSSTRVAKSSVLSRVPSKRSQGNGAGARVAASRTKSSSSTPTVQPARGPEACGITDAGVGSGRGYCAGVAGRRPSSTVRVLISSSRRISSASSSPGSFEETASCTSSADATRFPSTFVITSPPST